MERREGGLTQLEVREGFCDQVMMELRSGEQACEPDTEVGEDSRRRPQPRQRLGGWGRCEVERMRSGGALLGSP